MYTYQMKSKRIATKIPIKTRITGTTMAVARLLASRVLLPLVAAAVDTSLTESLVAINPLVTVFTETEMLANWSSGIWLVMSFTVLTKTVYILPGRRSEENMP